MCDYRLLPPEIEREVRQLSARPARGSPQEAMLLVDLLQKISIEQTPNYDMDGKPYYIILIRKLLKELPEDFTPRLVGGLARALGLGSRRIGVGYQIYWTTDQINILKDFLAKYK